MNLSRSDMHFSGNNKDKHLSIGDIFGGMLIQILGTFST